METAVNLNVNGSYMAQKYSGKINSIFATDDGSYVSFTVELDAPITVFALGEINSFNIEYRNGELNSVRKVAINIQ